MLLWFVETIFERLASAIARILVPSFHSGNVNVQWRLQRLRLLNEVFKQVDAPVEVSSKRWRRQDLRLDRVKRLRLDTTQEVTDFRSPVNATVPVVL